MERYDAFKSEESKIPKGYIKRVRRKRRVVHCIAVWERGGCDG